MADKVKNVPTGLVNEFKRRFPEERGLHRSVALGYCQAVERRLANIGAMDDFGEYPALTMPQQQTVDRWFGLYDRQDAFSDA